MMSHSANSRAISVKNSFSSDCTLFMLPSVMKQLLGLEGQGSKIRRVDSDDFPFPALGNALDPYCSPDLPGCTLGAPAAPKSPAPG